MHQTRITNHNQETGTIESRHQKLEHAEDLDWKCNLEKLFWCYYEMKIDTQMILMLLYNTMHKLL